MVASAAAWIRETSAATTARSALGYVVVVDAVGSVERAPALDEAAQREAHSSKPARDAAQEKKET